MAPVNVICPAPFAKTLCSVVLLETRDLTGEIFPRNAGVLRNMGRTRSFERALASSVRGSTNSTGPGSTSAMKPRKFSNTSVLCVGIIASPAKYKRDGESTAMHRTGTDPTGSIFTTLLRPDSVTRAPWSVQLRSFRSLRSRRNGRSSWYAVKVITCTGLQSFPLSRASRTHITGLNPSVLASSTTPCARGAHMQAVVRCTAHRAIGVQDSLQQCQALLSRRTKINGRDVLIADYPQTYEPGVQSLSILTVEADRRHPGAAVIEVRITGFQPVFVSWRNIPSRRSQVICAE